MTSRDTGDGHRPDRRGTARRLPLRHERDREQRRIEARLGEDFPRWLVLWGAWSRQFWAYPRFRAPRGTILHSQGPADLAAQMRQVQAMIAGGGR